MTGVVASNTVWTLCHGRGEAYLAALRGAFRQELEAAQQRILDSHDTDFPMDAARRLEQIAGPPNVDVGDFEQLAERARAENDER